jgi:hypothetical protein
LVGLCGLLTAGVSGQIGDQALAHRRLLIDDDHGLIDVRMRGRVAPMEYRITTYEPSARVVLTGEGSGVSAVDEIRFAPRTDGTGTAIDYTADIRLGG